MSGATDHAENRITDWLHRGQAWPLPPSWHIALFTSPPNDAGGGVEVSGGGYARVAVPRTLAAWSGTQGPGSTTPSTGTSGQASNNNPIDFPTATSAWGTVTHYAVFDAATGGNMILYGPLASPVTVNAGGSFSFAPGQCVLGVS